MTHEPVSRPFGGNRIPAPKSQQPHLGDEARSLLDELLAGGSVVTASQIAKFAERVHANPSRPGIEALAFLASSCRDAGEVNLAEALEKLSEGLSKWVDVTESFARFQAAAETRVASALAVGFEAGKQTATKALEADRSQPVRRTEFVTDKLGRVTGKVEYELKPTGGKP